MTELRPDSARFCPLCGDRLARQPVGPEGREHPVCSGCRFVFYLPPKVVACTLPVCEGRLLLTRRAIDPAKGLWTFPGGFVDWGEDVREGALRETREEVGLDVELGELLGVYSYAGAPVVIVVFMAAVRRRRGPGPVPDRGTGSGVLRPRRDPLGARWRSRAPGTPCGTGSPGPARVYSGGRGRMTRAAAGPWTGGLSMKKLGAILLFALLMVPVLAVPAAAQRGGYRGANGGGYRGGHGGGYRGGHGGHGFRGHHGHGHYGHGHRGYYGYRGYGYGYGYGPPASSSASGPGRS